jgi:ribonuclease-3
MSLFPEQILGHTFHDQSLLRQALTHPSYLNEVRGTGFADYQRLEFLGDAVLGLLLADLLYTRYPQLPEGDLSRLRSTLVDQARLAELATSAHISEFILLGRGEERDGGREKPSILADVLEAVIGAIYCDAGFDVVRSVIERLYVSFFENRDLIASFNDAKSELQELLVARKQPVPVYALISEEGPAHDRHFQVAVMVADICIGTGTGRSKKTAQQAAAQIALIRMKAEE